MNNTSTEEGVEITRPEVDRVTELRITVNDDNPEMVTALPV